MFTLSRPRTTCEYRLQLQLDYSGLRLQVQDNDDYDDVGGGGDEGVSSQAGESIDLKL